MMFSKSRSDIVGSAVKIKDEKDSSILNSQHTAGVYRCGWNIDKNRKRHWSMWYHASNVTSVEFGTGCSGGDNWCGTSVKIGWTCVGSSVKIWTGRVFSVESK